jgi:two-component system, chemotaxis family, chemotaxis protein CheY
MTVRVLVVDDTDHVRRMLVEMLTLDGFDVVGEATDGAHAVHKASEVDPEVIVMDLRMPGVDGIEATRRIKAIRPDQVVILYTAYLDPVIEEQARQAGVTVCLGKIEGLQELERELSRLTMELAPDLGG